MKFSAYSIETSGIKGICKSPSVWGHDATNNGMYPLIYLKKPKWMSDKQFSKVVKGITLNINANEDI